MAKKARAKKSIMLFSPKQNVATAGRGTSARKGHAQSRRFQIAVVDVDARAGHLSAVLDVINSAQRMFTFKQVIMPVRAELTLSGKRTQQVIAELGRRVSKAELTDNTYAPDLFKAAAPMARTMDFNVVGLLIARKLMEGTTHEDFQVSRFSTYEGRVFAVSAFDLRLYAAQVRRPFELCLAVLTVAQAFQVLFPRIHTHAETRGCMYDKCLDRDDVVECLKVVRICKESLALFPEWARADAERVSAAIESYDRPLTEGERRLNKNLRADSLNAGIGRRATGGTR
jgi:hypothetical protein